VIHHKDGPCLVRSRLGEYVQLLLIFTDTPFVVGRTHDFPVLLPKLLWLATLLNRYVFALIKDLGLVDHHVSVPRGADALFGMHDGALHQLIEVSALLHLVSPLLPLGHDCLEGVEVACVNVALDVAFL
jgi:hypothetical protein